jgi:hypothetical protein
MHRASAVASTATRAGAFRRDYFFFSTCLVCLRKRGEYFFSSSLLVPGFFMIV